MTPIDDVFMLSIEAKLDCSLLKKICETGHSRVPVYEEIDIPIPPDSDSLSSEGFGMLSTLPGMANSGPPKERTQRVKKILGILLVKNCVMLDPKGTWLRGVACPANSDFRQTQPLFAVCR
jgi:metal transporter CNNM